MKIQILKKSIVVAAVVLILMGLGNVAVASKGKVNINTADKKVLVTLKHVGDKLADRIIDYRQAHQFNSPQEIMKVKGVGQKVYDANKDAIVVSDE